MKCPTLAFHAKVDAKVLTAPRRKERGEEIPPLAIEVFRATAPVGIPRKATSAMPQKEWEANRKIEAARPAAHEASMRALARGFRHREIPLYQVTARAAMVEAVTASASFAFISN